MALEDKLDLIRKDSLYRQTKDNVITSLIGDSEPNSSSATWNEANCNPIEDIQELVDQIRERESTGEIWWSFKPIPITDRDKEFIDTMEYLRERIMSSRGFSHRVRHPDIDYKIVKCVVPVLERAVEHSTAIGRQHHAKWFSTPTKQQVEKELDALRKQMVETAMRMVGCDQKTAERTVDYLIGQYYSEDDEKGEQMINYSVVEVVVVHRESKEIAFESDRFVVSSGGQVSPEEQARLNVVAAEDCPTDVRADINEHIFIVSVIGSWTEKQAGSYR